MGGSICGATLGAASYRALGVVAGGRSLYRHCSAEECSPSEIRLDLAAAPALSKVYDPMHGFAWALYKTHVLGASKWRTNPQNVVSLADHFADANPHIVEDMRVHLSEAQNGRVRSYVMLRVTNDGNVIASYFYASKADEMALGRLIDTDEITEYTD